MARRGVVALAIVLTGCIGAGEFISPIAAYRIERRQCAHRLDEEAVRVCMAGVERKYARYWNEGNYPDESHIPGDFNR